MMEVKKVLENYAQHVMKCVNLVSSNFFIE